MYLVIVDELLQFISVYNNVQATHLGKTELLPIYTGKTDLGEQRGESKREDFMKESRQCSMSIAFSISDHIKEFGGNRVEERQKSLN